MYCSSCGAKFKKPGNFCVSCGASVDGSGQREKLDPVVDYMKKKDETETQIFWWVFGALMIGASVLFIWVYNSI